MKTKNFLSRFSAAALLAAALIPAALTSCSSDSEPNPVKEDPVPEGMAMINFSLATPDMSGATRAGDISNDNTTIAADKDEAAYTSLWLYIFKETTTAGTYALEYAYDCDGRVETGNDNLLTYKKVYLGSADGSGYVQGLAVTPGNYRFYVVANLDSYLSTTDAAAYKPAKDGKPTAALKDVTEKNIQDLSLTMYKNSAIQLAAGTLPMGMNYTDVQLDSSTDSNNATISSGTINIKKGSTNILCDMTFLCSAVRFTFIYDKENFSWNYSKFDVSSLTLNNINSGYKFVDTAENTSLASAATSQNLDLKKDDYKCSITSDQVSAFTSKDGKVTTLSKSTSTDWTKDAQHAYQGLIYVPSNYSTTENLKTYMTLTCDLGETDAKVYKIELPNSLTGSDNASDPNRLAKGNFYDIVGKMSASGMEFYVTVRKWKEGNRQVFDF